MIHKNERGFENVWKTNESFGLGSDLHVCYDVRLLLPANYEQPGWSKGNFIQPLVAAINCSLWVYYGLFKKERDIPLAAANAQGIVFGLVTAITALI